MTHSEESKQPVETAGLSVIIPVFNEGKSLIKVLKAVRKSLDHEAGGIEIIVVNDGSTDGFPRDAASTLSNRLIELERNRGYGAALLIGIRAARFETCAIIDADGTYPADRLPDLVRRYSENDLKMVVGARTGGVVEAPLLRRPVKYLLKKLADFLAGQPIPDLNSGLRVFNRSSALMFESLYPSGFSLSSTMTLAFLCHDLPVEFVPVNYYRRRGAKSKIRPWRDTKGILLTILRTVMYFDPLRVLFPISVGLGAGAAVLTILGLITGNVLDSTIAVLALASLQFLFFGLLADLVVRMSKKK